MSLNVIYCNQIKGKFWYGIFGDCKLIIDKETGFFNATKLCKSGGKLFKHWKENKNSLKLINFNIQKFGEIMTYIPAKGRNKDDLLIAGTYLHLVFFEDINKWTNRTKIELSGYVYIATTDIYKGHNIRKIGYTNSLKRRLENFNATRTNFDLFNFERTYKSSNARDLESRIHQKLSDVRLEKEFFKCDLEVVETIIRDFIDEESLMSKISDLTISS